MYILLESHIAVNWQIAVVDRSIAMAREYYRNDDPRVCTAVLKSLTIMLTPASTPITK